MWYQCPKCKHITPTEEHQTNLCVCEKCGYHERINADIYFSFLFDGRKFKELDSQMESKDPLKFEDTKKYKDRLVQTKEKTGLKDAITTGLGKIEGKPIVIACMNFNFIGGSMGAVVGEKISRAIQEAIKQNVAL